MCSFEPRSYPGEDKIGVRTHVSWIKQEGEHSAKGNGLEEIRTPDLRHVKATS